MQSPSVGGVRILEVGTANIALVPTDAESCSFAVLQRDIVEFWAHSFLSTHPITGSSLGPLSPSGDIISVENCRLAALAIRILTYRRRLKSTAIRPFHQ